MNKSTGMPKYLQKDPHPNEHGVLLSSRIKCYAEAGMISPFEEDKLKSAGYRLSIGDEYYLGGVRYQLQCSHDSIIIPPYEVAIIKTNEYLKIPWFLIARWNIRVSRAYDGLLWVGAAQVDPGYEGYLSCPIYNLSNKTIQVFRGENIALIDFVKTTKPNGDEIKTIKHHFGDFGRHLESGLLSNREQVDDLRNRVDAAEGRIWLFATLVIAMIGMVVALTAGITLSPNNSSDLGNNWILPLAIGMSFASASLSVLWVSGIFFRPLLKIFEKLSTGRIHTLREDVIHKKFFIFVGVALSATFIFSAYWVYDSGIGTVRNEQEKQKAQTEQKYEDIDQKFKELDQRIFHLEKSEH